MGHAKCRCRAAQSHIPRCIVTVFAFTAIVVKVHIAVGAQARVHIGRRTAAAIRKRQPVVDATALHTHRSTGLPLGVQALVHYQLGYRTFGFKWLRPALVVEIQPLVDTGGQCVAQAIPVGIQQAQPRN